MGREDFDEGIKILLFALGAGAGSLILTPLGLRAIWLSCALLALSFVLLF